ncbi:MAG: NADH-quinone oxidoreductase subunit NuoH [Candidatus Sumerlaeia bacterium]
MKQITDWLYETAQAPGGLPALPWWAWALAAALAGTLAVFAYVSVVVLALTYAERKVSGHMQVRLGPMRVGWHGLLQPIADAIKLLVKEDVVPARADKALFKLAPYLVMLGAFVPFAALPFSSRVYLAGMNAALFFVLSLSALEVLGVIMAGWGSANKWSLYGGMRLALQMVSYEIPMGLSALTVVAFTETLDLRRIVEQQGPWPWGWFVFQSPFTFLAFIIFFLSGLAHTKRLPFDLPEAESELVAGFHTEYSGMRFSFFFLAEYAAMYVISAVTAALFLGGWAAPDLPLIPAGEGFVVFQLKTGALLFVMLWFRWTFPRLRIDQVMYICLKVFLPFALACLLGAALQAVTIGPLLEWFR